MTVERHDVVDFAAIDSQGNAVLTISDHLPWDNINSHLSQLQEKTNCYLRFLESGEMDKRFPKLAGRPVVIDIVLKYPSPEAVHWFFKKVEEAIGGAGFRLTVPRLEPEASQN